VRVPSWYTYMCIYTCMCRVASNTRPKCRNYKGRNHQGRNRVQMQAQGNAGTTRTQVPGFNTKRQLGNMHMYKAVNPTYSWNKAIKAHSTQHRQVHPGQGNIGKWRQFQDQENTQPKCNRQNLVKNQDTQAIQVNTKLQGGRNNQDQETTQHKLVYKFQKPRE